MTVYTSETSVTPPAGAVEATIRAKGQPGEDVSNAPAAGDGHYAETTISLNGDNDTLYVRFGGGGAPGESFAGAGGDAADVRKNGTSLNDRVVVGAGGGGAPNLSENSSAAGSGGYPSGGDAPDVSGSVSGATGGDQTSGGGGGNGGSFGSGGDGVSDTYSGNKADYTSAGGGGGAGWYGGGGGRAQAWDTEPEATGGGGGSSYVENSVEASGTWTNAPEVVITYTTTDPPTAPGEFTATGITSSQIDLTWDSSSWDLDVGHYELSRGTSQGSYSQIDQLGNNVTSYSDTGLAAGTKYYYELQAVNRAGSNASADDAGTVIDAPTNLTGSHTL